MRIGRTAGCGATILYIQWFTVWTSVKKPHQPAKARHLFRYGGVISYVDRVIEQEERWHTIGSAGGIAVVLVVHTGKEEHGEEEIRIISARKATSRERAVYDAAH